MAAIASCIYLVLSAIYIFLLKVMKDQASCIHPIFLFFMQSYIPIAKEWTWFGDSVYPAYKLGGWNRLHDAGRLGVVVVSRGHFHIIGVTLSSIMLHLHYSLYSFFRGEGFGGGGGGGESVVHSEHFGNQNYWFSWWFTSI